MRDIRFRVWHRKDERWMDYQVMLPSGRVGTVTANGEVVPYADKDVAVCFRTGLLDRHGKEIYEGDIVLRDPQRNWAVKKLVVEWDRAGYWSPFVGEGLEGMGYENPDACEVIGNIYSNPELLNKQGEQKNDEAFRDPTNASSGIECPVKDCGGELLADYTLQFLSYPPKYKAECSKCGHETYI